MSNAPYLEIAAKLRDAIQSGDYAPGARLPTLQELADAHGVAINTAKAAVTVLRDDGLIVTQHGKGSFVRDDIPPFPDLDPDDDRPPYEQIADAIREAIAYGRYAIGSQLPSRIRLAGEFDVSPMTVQNAYRLLRDEGTIVTRQGSGVYVRSAPAKARDLAAEVDQLREEVAELRRMIADLVRP